MAWGKPGDAQSSSVVQSVIGSDVRMSGDVLSAGDLRLDGGIIGDLTCGSFTLGATGRVRGNVTAQRAMLAGAVEGTVTAADLSIGRSAQITGDVAYETITIESGARIDGRLSQDGLPTSGLRLVNAPAE